MPVEGDASVANPASEVNDAEEAVKDMEEGLISALATTARSCSADCPHKLTNALCLKLVLWMGLIRTVTNVERAIGVHIPPSFIRRSDRTPQPLTTVHSTAVVSFAVDEAHLRCCYAT